MNTNKRYNLLQGAFKAAMCLALLAMPVVSFAQPKGGHGENERKVIKAKKPGKVTKYNMKEISGYVYDAATKQPIGGVRLVAYGNSGYTALTEDNGSYTIKVPDFTTSLYIATEGYNTVQMPINGDRDQNVYLLSGVKNEFYSSKTSIIAPKKMSVTETSALTVEDDMQTYLGSSLRMITRGGMPAQGAVLLMNGINSLNANAQPLVVVDGVEMDMQYDRTTLHDGFVTNVFSIIDPEDIESVEVLKNGTARYGARGGNGVILINTKRGKSMATRIDARIWGGFTQSPSLQKVMNASQYRSYVTEMLGTMPSNENLAQSKTVGFLIDDPSYIFYPLYHNETNWQKDLYEDVFTQNYKISVEGGDDVAMYNLSLGYSAADATAKTNDFNRLNIRFNTDVNLFKGLVAGLDLSFARNAYNLRDNGWAEDYSMRNISSPNVLGAIQSPFISKYAHTIKYIMPETQADGTVVPGYLQLVGTDRVYSGKNYTDANNPFLFAEDYGYSGLVNPYWVLQNGDGNDKNYHEQTQFNLNVAPKYTINRYLTISDRFSYILNRTNEKYYLPKNGTPNKTVAGLGEISSVVQSQFGKLTTLYNDFNVDWHRQFAAHNVHLLGGFRIASYSYNDSYLTGYNNDQDKMPNMAYSLQYKQYGGTTDTWKNLQYYLMADYNFQQKYYVSAGVSAESSSRFGKEADGGVKVAGVAWGIFPTVQAGWVVTNEKWFNVKGIEYLKVNLGYEMSGNDNVDYYASRTYFENSKFLDKATALVISNIQNPKIQWETTHRFNIGLQASFLKNRLTFGIDYFKSRTTDLLTRKTVSDITGLASMWTNDGELENKGFEANVTGLILNKRNWRWQAGISAGHYKNEITKLPSSQFNQIELYALDENGRKTGDPRIVNGYLSSVYGTNNILTAVGRAAGVFYGYKTAGVFSTDAEASTASDKYGYLRYPTGLSQQSYRNFRAGDVHFVDVNGDGWISEADMCVIGDPNPDFYGNFWTSVSWKQLTLDLNFRYSVGNDVFNYQRQQLESANNIWNQTRAVVNRWRYEGQKTDVPRACATTSDYWVNNERFSDRWIEDGSYLKLRNVRLTYRIPINLSWLLGLSVWGEANNVFTITKYHGQDPECTAGNGVLYQGIDCGLLPNTRNFNLGVTINL